jgi:peptide/nickel transport system substrate-binding protein
MFKHGRLRRLAFLPLVIILVACSTATPASPTQAPATQAQQATSAPQATQAQQATAASPATQAPQATSAPQATPASQVTKGGDLVIGMGFDPGPSLDPGDGNAYDQEYIHMNIFDPLIWRAPDGTLVPGLAKSWDVQDGGKTFVFHLRQDVKFQDGTPFNAAAVKFSFDRIVDPKYPSFTTRTLMGPYVGTDVVDDYTAKVTFSAAYPAFLDAVSQWWLVPVSPTAVQKYGADFGSHPVGTGPFMLKEHVNQDHVTLVRNPDYNWAPSFFNHQGPAYLNSITFKFIPEPANRAGTLESGEIQMAQDVAPTDIQRLQSNASLKLYREKLPGMPTILMMNTECGPTSDPAVRQALEYGTPKQQIIDTMWGGMYDPAYGPLTKGMLGYDPSLESMYTYDPAKAKQILDAAGWTVGSGGIRQKNGQPLSLALNTMSFNRFPEVLQVPVAAWKDLGIDAKVMDWPQFSSAAWGCKHSMLPYFTPASDPYFAMSDFYLSTNVDKGFAFTRLRDPKLDALLNQGASATDDAARQQAYQQASDLIMSDAAILPLYVPYNLTMASTKVVGLQYAAQGWYPELYNVYIQQ